MRQQIIPVLITLLICVILGLLVYSYVSYPSWQEVMEAMEVADPADAKIRIRPYNPDWDINLTTRSFWLEEFERTFFLDLVTSIQEQGHRNNLKRIWETRVDVYLPGQEPIYFVFYNTPSGLFCRIEGVQGYHTFSCDPQLVDFLELWGKE
jgi:hypothetical protein